MRARPIRKTSLDRGDVQPRWPHHNHLPPTLFLGQLGPICGAGFQPAQLHDRGVQPRWPHHNHLPPTLFLGQLGPICGAGFQPAQLHDRGVQPRWPHPGLVPQTRSKTVFRIPNSSFHISRCRPVSHVTCHVSLLQNPHGCHPERSGPKGRGVEGSQPVQRSDACPATLFSTCGDPSTRSSNSLAQGDRRERYRSNIAEGGVLQEAHVSHLTCHCPGEKGRPHPPTATELRHSKPGSRRA